MLLFPAAISLWARSGQTVRAGTGWTLAMEGGPGAVSGRAGMQADSEPCVAGIAVLGAALDGWIRKPWSLGCGGVDATATQFGPASHLANQRLV